MAIHLFDKLTNFLMPPQDGTTSPQDDNISLLRSRDRRSYNFEQSADGKPHFILHSQASSAPLKIFVEESTCFDDVQKYADYLKANHLVLINYQQVDSATQQRMGDFMNGICYALGGSVQRVTEQVILYAYANIYIDKKLFAYSVPTYVRVKTGEQQY